MSSTFADECDGGDLTVRCCGDFAVRNSHSNGHSISSSLAVHLQGDSSFLLEESWGSDPYSNLSILNSYIATAQNPSCDFTCCPLDKVVNCPTARSMARPYHSHIY